jgi:hypothetical protein
MGKRLARMWNHMFIMLRGRDDCSNGQGESAKIFAFPDGATEEIASCPMANGKSGSETTLFVSTHSG